MKLQPGNSILSILIFPATLFLAINTAADETSSPGKSDESAVITPANMTREDGYMLKEHASRYNECLTETSVGQLQAEDDPRRVVDHAMKACAVKLEELDRKMKARNFDPDFRKGYIRTVSNRSANNVLRIVMMGMAARDNQEN